MKNINQKLLHIQKELKAPKGQYNSFGKYSYRNCEDILESLKPLLVETNTVVTLTDEIKQVGDRFYVEAKASLTCTETNETVSVSAYAREDETKKGMDLSQVTGSTSSYARKYALNGLFAIDDNKDSDFTNKHETKLTEAQIKRLYAIANSKGIPKSKVDEQIFKKFYKEASNLSKEEYDLVCDGYEKIN